MADVKISALPALTSAALTDLFAVVQGGVTYKGTLTQLVAAIPDATGSARGILSSADWTTFNGKIGAIGTINSVAKAANGAVNSSGSLIMQTADGTNPGLVSTGTQTFAGNKTFTGESATVGNALVVNNLTPTSKFTVANAGRVSLTSDTTVTAQTVSVITTDTTNAGLVLRPNGTGAIMAQAPDGTATGGNARGANAVDLQMSRTSNTQVASSNFSSILAGQNNTLGTSTAGSTHASIVGGLSNSITGANTKYSFIGCGQSNTVTTGGEYAVIVGGQSNQINNFNTHSCILGGQSNLTQGNHTSVGGGQENNAAATYSSISGGFRAIGYLYGQRANASGRFSANGDAQTSSLTFRRSINGQLIAELFLDGASIQAILSSNRAWRAQVDVVAIVSTVGNGTVTLGDCFMGSYHVGIKRIGTATSLVGAVSVTNEVNDAGMAGAAVTITADDTNEALKIEFTPATNAGSTTVTRVVATAYLTEVGY